MTSVVALGGNAPTRPGERGGRCRAAREPARRARGAAPWLLGEPEPGLVTHGGGPQVGNEPPRHERAADEAPPLLLYLAVAQTQAEIGALIESELAPVAERPVACLLTHVVVDEDDTDLLEPDQAGRPVRRRGPRQGARARPRLAGGSRCGPRLEARRAVTPAARDRRAGGDPRTRRHGTIAIACGGGGIPVARRDGRLPGVDAVIDKDRASSLLARAPGPTGW